MESRHPGQARGTPAQPRAPGSTAPQLQSDPVAPPPPSPPPLGVSHSEWSAPAEDIKVVQTARELQDAAVGGARDIEIHFHLDLRSLSRVPNPAIEDKDSPLYITALLYAFPPLRSILVRLCPATSIRGRLIIALELQRCDRLAPAATSAPHCVTANTHACMRFSGCWRQGPSRVVWVMIGAQTCRPPHLDVRILITCG